MYRYRVQGHSLTVPGRIIRLTVNARDADDARRVARLRVPDFGATTRSPRRVGRVLDEPEQADGMTQAKARDDLRDGVAHFEWHGHDIEVEVS